MVEICAKTTLDRGQRDGGNEKGGRFGMAESSWFLVAFRASRTGMYGGEEEHGLSSKQIRTRCIDVISMKEKPCSYCCMNQQ